MRPAAVRSVFAKMRLLPFAAVLWTVGWAAKLQGQSRPIATSPQKALPKDVFGYMGIPWGISSEQALQSFFQGKPQGYASGLSADDYEVDVESEKFGFPITVIFYFTPDKARLWMVLIQTDDWVKNRDLDRLERACLAEMVEECGLPGKRTRQDFDDGMFIMRRWRFSSTRILFGRYRGNGDLDQGRLVIRYLVARKHDAPWDLRDRLFPLSDRTTGESWWRMGNPSDPQEITPAEDDAILNGGSKAKD